MRKALGDTTTENGQPVPMLHAQFDGEVTYPSLISSEESFEDVIEEADPIIDSIEFHAP